jgi:hypothetical protein
MNEKNHTAVLLQIISHDLLAPLTAIKWQTELLNRESLSKEKEEVYKKGISDATEMSISLLQTIGNTAVLLKDEYTPHLSLSSVDSILKESWLKMQEQYNRHGIKIDASFDQGMKKEIDTMILEVFVWYVGKFFLSFSLAGESVLIRGVCLKKDEKCEKYTMTVSTRIEENTHLYAHLFEEDSSFSEKEIKNIPPHSYIFSEFIKKTASLSGILFSTGRNDDIFTFEASF